MWFDVSTAMARLTEGDSLAFSGMTDSNTSKVAEIAEIASALPLKFNTVLEVRANGLDPDAGAYHDFVRIHGPSTYGAIAVALGWGATRAWLAEARLTAAGIRRLVPSTDT